MATNEIGYQRRYMRCWRDRRRFRENPRRCRRCGIYDLGVPLCRLCRRELSNV